MRIVSPTLDHNSPIPLYQQLKEILIERIRSGVFTLDQPFPTEAQIVKEFDVSRVTVRRALQEMVQEGDINRFPGRGTFIIHKKVNRELSRLTSFTEDMQARGQTVTTKVLEVSFVEAGPVVAEKLGVQPGARLLYVNRLRLVDQDPIAINFSYLNLPQKVEISKEELMQTNSLWALLQSKEVPLLEADKTIEAVAADKHRASMLQVPQGAPLLVVEGIVYTNNHIPVEYFQVISRGDRYKYAVHQAR